MKTASAFFKIISEVFKETPVVEPVSDVADVREWELEVKLNIEGISRPHCFRLLRRAGGSEVYMQTKENMQGDDNKWTPENGDLVLEKMPTGTPTCVPLKPSQLDRFEVAVNKYEELKAFDGEHAAEWRAWVRDQRERQGAECSTCHHLTTKIRDYGTRSKDSDEEASRRRKIHDQAQKELRAHVLEQQNDENHKCRRWELPPPCLPTNMISTQPAAVAAAEEVKNAQEDRRPYMPPVVVAANRKKKKPQARLPKKRKPNHGHSDSDDALDKLAEGQWDGASEDDLKSSSDRDSDSESSNEEPGRKKPHWKSFPGIKTGQLAVLAGEGPDGWWEGKIDQLLAVASDDDTEGDLIVQQYAGVGADATFKGPARTRQQ